jgi:hypothetical protein
MIRVNAILETKKKRNISFWSLLKMIFFIENVNF